MPTEGGYDNVAGELTFPSEAELQAWLEHVLTYDEVDDLGALYFDLHEVEGTVADAFGNGVELLRDGLTVHVAAADLIVDGPGDHLGATTKAVACACILAAQHGARGSVFFDGQEEYAFDFSFVVELDDDGYRLLETEGRTIGDDERWVRAAEAFERRSGRPFSAE